MNPACSLDPQGWSRTECPLYTLMQHAGGAFLWLPYTPGNWSTFRHPDQPEHRIVVNSSKTAAFDTMLDDLRRSTGPEAQARLRQAHQQVFLRLLDLQVQGTWLYDQALATCHPSRRPGGGWAQDHVPSDVQRRAFEGMVPELDRCLQEVKDVHVPAPDPNGYTFWSNQGVLRWSMPTTQHARLHARQAILHA